MKGPKVRNAYSSDPFLKDRKMRVPATTEVERILRATKTRVGQD